MRQSFSLAAASSSALLGRVGAFLQHQHSFPMLLQSHCISLHILKNKNKKQNQNQNLRYTEKHTSCYHTWPFSLTKSHGARTVHYLIRHTLRMRMKSCLSTRRKWQLSSLKMMVAARGASFSKASCPKSSPSCRVVTSPCMHTIFSALH